MLDKKRDFFNLMAKECHTQSSTQKTTKSRESMKLSFTDARSTLFCGSVLVKTKHHKSKKVDSDKVYKYKLLHYFLKLHNIKTRPIIRKGMLKA